MLKKFLIGTFVAFVLLVGVTASASYDFGSTTLRVGSRGDYVKTLQTLVGASPVDGVFGPMTAAKVKVWQAANGLTADGVFGPMSMAKANLGLGGTSTQYPAGCTSNTGYSSTTGQSCAVVTTLPAGCTSTAGYSSTTGAKCDGSSTGGTTGVLGTSEGDVVNIDEVSSKDSKLEEGKSNELFAFTAEIEGDVSVDRVDFYLDSTDAGAQSENADDYFKSASLLVNGTKVATVDVDNFSEDNYGEVSSVVGDSDEYRIRFSGLNKVFKDGDKPKFVLAFEANPSIDGTDLSETWGVELSTTDSIRFVDGRGFSGDAGTDISETFTADTQDTAKISINSSSDDPEITTFEVSDSDETKDKTVFVFEVEEKNDVDVTINDMTVTLTTTGTADESAVVSSADLYKGSTLLGSESVPNGGVVEFTDLGLDVDAGDSVDLTLKLTFADVDGYTEGTTVTAVLTSVDKADDANGNDEGDMTVTGEGLSSETHILRSTGISVDVKSAVTTITAQDLFVDNATFKWVFDVTAFGDNDVYINKDVADIVTSSTAGDVDVLYSLEYSGGAALTSVGGTLVESDTDVTSVTADASAYSGAYSGETFYKINNGTVGTFTLTITGTNQTDAKQVRALLNDIEWTTDDITSATAQDAATATINSYTSGLGADAATQYESIS